MLCIDSINDELLTKMFFFMVGATLQLNYKTMNKTKNKNHQSSKRYFCNGNRKQRTKVKI